MTDINKDPEPTAASGAVAIFVLGGFAGVVGGILSESVSNKGDWVFENPILFGAIVGVVVIHLMLLALIAVRLWSVPVQRAEKSPAE